MTAGEWLDKAATHLQRVGVPEALANAEFLMAAVLKTGRAELRLHRGRTLTVKQSNHFWHLSLQRARRVPLAYVLGTQPFLGHEIAVGRGVLVPRPETEELVLEAAALFRGREAAELRFLEVGTGTGCIAVALAARFPQALVYATDLSPEALRLAERNVEAHHLVGRVRLIREDLFRPAADERRGWADLVVSNPPYIPTGEIDRLEPEVLHEPRLALDGGPDGLSALRAIVSEAPRHLKRGGALALEIGHDQGPAVRGLLEAAGFSAPSIRRDAQGLDRFALAKW